MKKKTLSAILTLVMLLALCAPAFAANVVLSPQNLTVDGKAVTCEKYNIGGANYFKLRDLAQALSGTSSQFEVGWDGATGTVSITTGKAYTSVGGELSAGADKSSTAQVSKQTIQINGVTRSDLSAYNIGGANFFKLRDLGTALGFGVDFNSGTNTAVVKSSATTTRIADDYTRALELGYIDSAWGLRARDSAVRSTEYKALLTAMIQKNAPEKLDYFNSKVTDYDIPVTRGMAVVMSWYAAVCIGADNYNDEFESEQTKADADFGYQDSSVMARLFPDCNNGRMPVTVSRYTWGSERDAALLWNIWHSSPVSRLQVIAWDYAAESLHSREPLTAEDAACAVARLGDSLLHNQLTSISSPEATSVPFSSALLQKASASKMRSIDELPRLTGFVLMGSGSYAFGQDGQVVAASDRDIQNIADWGFNSARISMQYEALFSEDCSKVRMVELERLDKLVAAAVENNIHLNLLTTTLPGRTTYWLSSDKVSGDFDLFLNNEKQARAIQLWQFLAERYKDIPGEYLSFTPFFEATNESLDTNQPAQPYREEDVANVLDKLIRAIREKDSARFIIYEPASDNGLETILRRSSTAYQQISAKYDNVCISFNFAQQPYQYYTITSQEAAAAGVSNMVSRGMFVPDYPTIIYSARDTIEDGKDLLLDGFLPAGTHVDLYVSQTNGTGTFSASSEDGTLLEEPFSTERIHADYPYSQFFHYATSDKKLSFTLEQATDTLTLHCVGGSLQWCGMDVTLPTEYAVERWYAFPRSDDIDTAELVKTSTIMIGANSHTSGAHLTINKDITFTSEKIFAAATAETIDAWGGAIHDYAPGAVVRFESAWTLGKTQTSILKYYDDLLGMCDKYHFDWWSNDYSVMALQKYEGVIGETKVAYAGYPRFNLELLKVLQKHR